MNERDTKALESAFAPRASAGKVTDTRKIAENDPMQLLAEAAVFGPSGAIYAQEARGAAELVASGSQLPREGLLVGFDRHAQYDRKKNGEKEPEPELLPIWKALGITLVGLGGDDLFADVKLPAGWKIIRTEHSMWTDLLDAKGRKRAGIFYKAAFYDRGAHISVDTFFRATPDYGGEYGSKYAKGEYRYLVLARDGREFFASEVIKEGENATREEADAAYRKHSAVEKSARAWLDACFPDNRNPLAYWDEDVTIPTPEEVAARERDVIDREHVEAIERNDLWNQVRGYPKGGPGAAKRARKPKQGKRKK